MNDLGAAITAAVNNGGPGGRISVGPNPVFGVINARGPRTVLSAFTQVPAEGMTFNATVLAPSGTPAAKVGPGATKPVGLTVSQVPKTLLKWAAQSTFTLEDVLSSASSLIGNVADALLAQCIAAAEVDAVAELDRASTPPLVPPTSNLAGLLGAQAEVASRGYAPSVVSFSALDWAAIGSEIAAGPGFGADPGDALVQIAGTSVIVSPGQPSGVAYVWDPDYADFVIREAGALANPYAASDTNTISVVSDLIGAPFITADGAVASFSTVLA